VRIVHVLAPAGFGGLESVVRGLAVGQRERGHEVHVLPVFPDHAELADARTFIRSLTDRQVEVLPLVVGARRYLRERAWMRRAFTGLRPEVVHTHGMRADAVDAPVARREAIPTLTTVHGFTGGNWKMRLSENVHVSTLRRLDAVVAVSRPLAGRLREAGVRAARVHVVPNAWVPLPAPTLSRARARAALGVEADRFHVGWVGRLSREKGADVLLDAVARLADLPLQVSLVGSGPERGALEDRLRSAGLGAWVRLHGAIEDAGRIFRAFDAFVLSSRTEGTPIALLEAIAAGVPVVATSVGGVPDVVSPAEAKLVAPEDPAALAAAIRELYTEPAALTRARVCAAKRRLLLERGMDPWLDRYEDLYRRIRTEQPATAR
jgi:glycosyltransferase involved in cell wall biosynthesis